MKLNRLRLSTLAFGLVVCGAATAQNAPPRRSCPPTGVAQTPRDPWMWRRENGAIVCVRVHSERGDDGDDGDRSSDDHPMAHAESAPIIMDPAPPPRPPRRQPDPQG